MNAVMGHITVSALRGVYDHVDDVDLFTGGLAERPVVGGTVGPTFACIIGQQFLNLRKGDRQAFVKASRASMVSLTGQISKTGQNAKDWSNDRSDLKPR